MTNLKDKLKGYAKAGIGIAGSALAGTMLSIAVINIPNYFVQYSFYKIESDSKLFLDTGKSKTDIAKNIIEEYKNSNNPLTKISFYGPYLASKDYIDEKIK